MRHIGTECFGMKMDFGWDRYHNAKRENVPLKISLLEQTPVILGSATTFHPVPPEFQQRLHTSIAKARSEEGDAIENRRAQTMSRSHKWLVGQWNCTLQAPDAKLAGSQKDINGICQQHAQRNPPLRNKIRPLPGVTKPIKQHWKRSAPATGNGGGDVVFINTVARFAPEGAAFKLRARAVHLAHKSLLATGSIADVVFVTDDKAQKLFEPLHQESNVVVVEAPAPAGDHNLFGFAGFAAVVATYLSTHRGNFTRVLLTTSNAIFQRDPFKAIPLRDGVAAFVTERYPEKLVDFHQDPSVTFDYMGVCSGVRTLL